MGRHALLSASSSHRWLACPPSARVCENYEDTGSEYAQQGTDAHSLCEHKLKLSLGMETADPTEGLAFYDEEMEECACGYAEYVFSLVEEAKKTCRDSVVLIEQRLDFSRYVEEGFGTGDCYRRLKPLGATHMTGGGNTFYEKIGFKPLVHWTFWEKKTD